MGGRKDASAREWEWEGVFVEGLEWNRRDVCGSMNYEEREGSGGSRSDRLAGYPYAVC